MRRGTKVVPVILTLSILFSISQWCNADNRIRHSKGAAFRHWSPAKDLNNNGAPYWDHSSSDGANYNIGFCLTGSGSCVGALFDPPPGVIPFAAMSYVKNSDTGGAFDPNFSFLRHRYPYVPPMTATLEARIGTGSDSFGYALVNSEGSIIGGSFVTLFTAGDAVGTTVTFFPGGRDYALWLQNGNCMYVTLSGQNPCDTPGNQHFVVFVVSALFPSTYWIGCEDTPFAQSDLDYSDMIVKITEQQQ